MALTPCYRSGIEFPEAKGRLEARKVEVMVGERGWIKGGGKEGGWEKESGLGKTKKKERKGGYIGVRVE